MNPQELTAELKSIYEDRLGSVIIYGSAANGEFNKGHSDYNILIILKETSPVEIARSSKLIKKWTKKGNPLPLFFTQTEIHEAYDVFPIEFFDMKVMHKALYGASPFKDINIDTKNLRHQCEHEMRSKMLNLKSKFALLADDPNGLIKLILDSSSSFFAIFKGVLRLAGTEPATSKKSVVEQLAKFVDFDTAIFIKIVDIREGSSGWKKEEALEKFEQYLTSLGAVVRYVDKF